MLLNQHGWLVDELESALKQFQLVANGHGDRNT